MKNHDYSLSVLCICLKNLCVIAFFIFLATFFKHWWISLFSIIFQSSVPACSNENTESELSNILRCYSCGEILYVANIEDAVNNEIRQHKWLRTQTGGKWINLCPHCAMKYFKKQFTSYYDQNEVE